MTREWLTRAACIGAPDAIFFPSTGVGSAPAKAICGGCPIRERCLTDWLDFEDGLPAGRRYGVVGGLSAEERARLNRKATGV